MVQPDASHSRSRLPSGEPGGRQVFHQIGVRVARVAILIPAALAAGVLVSSPPSSAALPMTTTSHYKATVDPGTFGGQGRAAGRAGAQGLAILDFGRPAANGPTWGTMDFGGNFVSLNAAAAATLSYVRDIS